MNQFIFSLSIACQQTAYMQPELERAQQGKVDGSKWVLNWALEEFLQDSVSLELASSC